MPIDYPGTSPPVTEIPMRNKILSDRHLSSLVQHLNDVANDNIGMPVVFTLVDAKKGGTLRKKRDF